MADRRTIYVSSTFDDLKAHRAALKAELERAGFDVESMERYAAFAEPPLDRCLADVAACDGYVLLLAHRYGFVPKAGALGGRSITQLEYVQAQDKRKPTFVFCVDPDHPWSPKLVDKGDAAARLDAFRAQVEGAHGRRTFTTEDNLVKQVLAALSSHVWPAAIAATAALAPAGYRWPKPWDFSAYMAAKREVFEGRDWLFEKIAAWQRAGEPRALLIRADFGVGKSAVMAQYVERHGGHEVLAWHFCLHDTQETLLPGAFVRSLAAQLAQALPAYRQLVEADPALQERLDGALADPGTAFDAAVLAPLARLEAPAAPRVLMIDALDESLELDEAAARRGGTLVSLLAAKAGRFPPWLLVLATSRPNPRVQTPLQHAFGLDEIDAESAGNLGDLDRYIRGRAAREPLAGILKRAGRQADALAATLVPRSQGKFLFAVRALRDLESGRIGIDELAALPPGMDSFYLDAFERRYTRAGLDYRATRQLLGLLCAAREPMPPALLAEVLQTDEAEVKAVHKALPDFLRQRAGRLAFDHFSIAEWLTRDDSEGFARAGDFAVDLPAAQQQLRRWALRCVDEGRAQASPYLLRHLAAHLDGDDERREVYARLMLQRFDWLQARLALSGADALLADCEHLRGHAEYPFLLALLRNSAHVLRAFRAQLPAQLLGRAGLGLGAAQALRALAESARRWLAEPGQALAYKELLLPGSRSLRLSTAQLATFVGGPVLVALPDGRLACGAGNTVRLWDPARSAEAVAFEGHANTVKAIAVLPDGRIASGSEDRTVRLWNPARPAEVVVFEGHAGAVEALAVLPDGRIASGSWDHTVRLWNPARPAETLVFEGHADLVATIAALPDGRIASGSWDHTVRLWNPARPAETLVFEGHTDRVEAMAVLPDGRIASGSDDDTVRLWNPARPAEVVVFEGHANRVEVIAVLPDGRIASGSWDHTVRLWNPARPAETLVFEGHAGRVEAIAVLPNGRIVSGSWDHTVRLWNLARPTESVVFEGHADTIAALAVLPEGRIASGSRDHTVRLWNPARLAETVVFEGHAGPVKAVAVLPDGRIASGSSDHTVRLWNPARPAETLVFEGHTDRVEAIAVLPDGRVASGSDDDTVRLWNPACPAEVVVFEGHAGMVRAIAVLSGGRIVSGSWDKTVRLWNPARPAESVVLNGHAEWVEALAVLPDGRIASGSWDHTVRLWDPARPAEALAFEGHTDRVAAIAVLPDGRIASGSWDRTVRLWSPTRPAETVVFEGHALGVAVLAVLPDGRIASGSSDRTVRLWDPARPAESMVFEGHAGPVAALAVLPDGRIASGAWDHTVRLWDPARARPTRLFVADAPILCLAATPDGLIVAGCADGAVHFLREAGAG